MRRRLTCIAAVLATSLAGCGIGSTGPVPAGPPASGLREPGSASHVALLYFIGPSGLQAAPRQVKTALSPQQSLDLLLKGPDAAELARGLISEVPPMHGRLAATADNGAVNLYLPVRVAQMNGGGFGLSQIICTAANAQVPGGKQPPDVDVRVHEDGTEGTWTVRCNAAGVVVPVPDPSPSQGQPGIGPVSDDS